MKYIVDSKKSVEEAGQALEKNVVKHKFGVLHVHDLKQTLQSKGVDFETPCHIYEVCNPHQAKKVLTEDMTLNMALPCRVSIWEEGGITKIGMIPPKAMLAMLSTSEELTKIAQEVEETMKAIIIESA